MFPKIFYNIDTYTAIFSAFLPFLYAIEPSKETILTVLICYARFSMRAFRRDFYSSEGGLNLLARSLIMSLANNIGNNVPAASIGNSLVNEGFPEEKGRRKPAAHTIQSYIEALPKISVSRTSPCSAVTALDSSTPHKKRRFPQM